VVLSPHHVVDERVPEPAQLLVGLTAIGSARFGGLSEPTLALQRAWPDGVFAELAQLPAACATPAGRNRRHLDSRLAAIAKFLVPYGGLLRGGLAAGQTVVVNGATGYFGSAGVVLAAALGAARVVAAGRDRETLEKVVAPAGPRAASVALTGDAETDARALRDAAGGGADVALDLVGRAQSATSTLATLRSLRRGGRLVVMGSVAEPLPVSVGELLANEWTIAGAFMYPREAPSRLLGLVGAKLLDLGVCRVREFPLADLDAAMTAAAAMRGLDFVALVP
jgi:alcohol dehydrogenase